jgi:SAM-dependent MidA family methyltransferase
LLDVSPVHRLRTRGATFTELYVTLNKSRRLIEIEDEVSPEASRELEISALPRVPDASEITVSPTRTKWLQHMAEVLRRGGHLITVDYATKSFEENPLSYVPRVYANFLEPHTGHPVELAYERPGTMDITASVDFRQLAEQGAWLGLRSIYRSTQTNFLRANGFEAERDYVMKREAQTSGQASPLAHYFASYVLLAPEHMGNHEVLIQRSSE